MQNCKISAHPIGYCPQKGAIPVTTEKMVLVILASAGVIVYYMLCQGPLWFDIFPYDSTFLPAWIFVERNHLTCCMKCSEQTVRFWWISWCGRDRPISFFHQHLCWEFLRMEVCSNICCHETLIHIRLPSICPLQWSFGVFLSLHCHSVCSCCSWLWHPRNKGIFEW